MTMALLTQANPSDVLRNLRKEMKGAVGKESLYLVFLSKWRNGKWNLRQQFCRLKEIDWKMHLECGNSIKHVAVWLIWDSSHRGSNTVEDLACQSTSYLFPLNRISLFCVRCCLQHLWRLQNQAIWLIFFVCLVCLSIAARDAGKYQYFGKSSLALWKTLSPPGHPAVSGSDTGITQRWN